MNIIYIISPLLHLKYVNFRCYVLKKDVTEVYHEHPDVGLKAVFNEYFSKGGFPAYLKSGNKQYLKSLCESILYRDVMVRNGLINAFECNGD